MKYSINFLRWFVNNINWMVNKLFVLYAKKYNARSWINFSEKTGYYWLTYLWNWITMIRRGKNIFQKSLIVSNPLWVQPRSGLRTNCSNIRMQTFLHSIWLRNDIGLPELAAILLLYALYITEGVIGVKINYIIMINDTNYCRVYWGH